MRTPRVLRPFRRLIGAIEDIAYEIKALVAVLAELHQAQQAMGPAVDRLGELEASRHQFEATCEGLLMKAEGKLRAANNAEARERANKKSYEHLLDPFPEEGVEPETPTRYASGNHDAPPGEAERLQAMRLDVAPSNKTLAQRAKFGVR